MSWDKVVTMSSESFRCGFCGERISSQTGYKHSSKSAYRIYICHFCDFPNTFFAGNQYPGAVFGNKVDNVPDNINSLYKEARNCMTVQAYTASVMACRKLLMNIAVEKGAEEGLSFKAYVEYLDSQNYIPPDGKEWVDHIREKGNEANHEIKIMERKDAEELIVFIEMLLKFIYEFPGKMKAKQDSQGSDES